MTGCDRHMDKETYFDHFLKLSESNSAIYNPVDEALFLLLQNRTLEKEEDGRLLIKEKAKCL